MAAQRVPRKRDSLLDTKDRGIIQRVTTSSFGSFNTALEKIRPLIPDVELALPRVVVVGSRDAGKSSLLENVTKCSIFPRDKGLCTRMPIKLHLQQVHTREECSCALVYNGVRTSVEFADDVLSRVTSVMKEIGSFSKEELVVELKQVHLDACHLLVVVTLTARCDIQRYSDKFAVAGECTNLRLHRSARPSILARRRPNFNRRAREQLHS